MMIQNNGVIMTMVACLLFSTSTLAADNKKADDIDYQYKDSEMTPCGVDEINLIPSRREIKAGDITYVSGGVCSDDAQFMKNIAKKYPLEIVLVEKTAENEKESYIADVHVKIMDKAEKVLLDIRSEGPFLLVNLPDGQYQVTAEYNTIAKTKPVKVINKKHERVVFLWVDSPA